MRKGACTFIDQEAVINKPWITAKDIMTLAPVYEPVARKIMKDIQDEMDANQEPRFYTRPEVVPLTKVLKKMNIEASYIRRQAELMRKAGYES